MSEHHHHHHHEVTGTKLFITVLLNVIITLSQVVGGILSGSLALLSDALHNFSDVVALVTVYVANRIAQRKPTAERTFGYKRIELLAALGNGVVLVGVALFLIMEAVQKLQHPEPIASNWVIGLALLSIVLNWVSVVLVSEDAKSNSNVKAAYLHLMTDVMTSVAVLVGGVAMLFWQVYWIDPMISLMIAGYLMFASWDLIRQTSSTLMLFTPDEVQAEQVVEVVQQFPEIENIHHLHLWKLDDHEVHLEAHLDFKEDLPLSQVTKVLEALEQRLAETLAIQHFNLQPEFDREDDKSLILESEK